jgi:hypothetical protein
MNTNKKQTTPKLVCNVTGSSRVTNRKYLQAKADKKNTTVEEFLSYYVSKDTLRQLKAGRSVAEIREDYGLADIPSNEMTQEWVDNAVKMNGKNGPSGPHAKPSSVSEPSREISPEVEKLIKTVQEKQATEA